MFIEQEIWKYMILIIFIKDQKMLKVKQYPGFQNFAE